MPAGDLGVRSCIRTGGSKAPKKYWMTNQTLAKTIAVVVTATNRRHRIYSFGPDGIAPVASSGKD
jgi:hypothetical protein